MELTNVIEVTKKFSGRSKFDFWKNIKEGDCLLINLSLKWPHDWAYNTKVTNLRTDEEFDEGAGRIINYIHKLGYKDSDYTIQKE